MMEQDKFIENFVTTFLAQYAVVSHLAEIKSEAITYPPIGDVMVLARRAWYTLMEFDLPHYAPPVLEMQRRQQKCSHTDDAGRSTACAIGKRAICSKCMLPGSIVSGEFVPPVREPQSPQWTREDVI